MNLFCSVLNTPDDASYSLKEVEYDENNFNITDAMHFIATKLIGALLRRELLSLLKRLTSDKN
jgi:hypothetical protein